MFLSYGLKQRLSKSPVQAVRSLSVQGIFPPIATPFTSKEDIDYEQLSENLKKWSRVPFKGKY